MLREQSWAWTLMLLLPAFAWTDEPEPVRQIKRQRVSPKLLREAMALPEYKLKIQSTESPSSDDQVRKLADKLKSTGDPEGAELLERFLIEHQKVVQRLSQAERKGAELDVRFQAIDVDLQKLGRDSILLQPHDEPVSAALVFQGLENAIQNNSAESLFESVTLSSREHEATRFQQGSGRVIPSSDGSVAKRVRPAGTAIEFTAEAVSDQKFRLEVLLRMSHGSVSRSGNAESSKFSAEHGEQFRAVIETRTGEIDVQPIPWNHEGHKFFLVTQVIASK